MEPAGRGSIRKKGLGNQPTHQVTWRPWRSSGSERTPIRTKQEGQDLQGQPVEVRPPGWKNGPFLLSWNRQNEGKKGLPSGQVSVTNHACWRSLFSKENNDLAAGKGRANFEGEGAAQHR